MVKPGTHPMDPRGLIREAFQIEGIGPEDCRSIFFDWATGLAADTPPGAAAKALAEHYAAPEGHPMTQLLVEAQVGPPGDRPSRRRRAAANGRR
ncbi:MAG: hypothetical protein AAF677_01720 [Pseudomonadota bacterium]